MSGNGRVGNTLLLRLEGPLQAWGGYGSKFVVRRTHDAPTKSGVLGILCAAMGIGRKDSRSRLSALNDLRLGVRIDRPGVRWWDYHTVGGGARVPIAERIGKTKPGAMLTRREYLCDASFLVALRGDENLLNEVHTKLHAPEWPIFLGRKCCPPSVPLLGQDEAIDTGDFANLEDALCAVPWRRRTAEDAVPASLQAILEWRPMGPEDVAPVDAEVWNDVAISFDVPGHEPRLVVREWFGVGATHAVRVEDPPRQSRTPAPLRPRADYRNSEYRVVRKQRLERDGWLCVFCKSPGTTVQHVTYRRAGGQERLDDLRSLCRLCHDAITMIEYGMGMGLDRINPEDPQYRQQILDKRREIIATRSLEMRRRWLEPDEVE